jgi:hypothetical protein
MHRLQPLLATLRQAVPSLEVEELRLVGDRSDSPATLPALLGRVQAATDLDLGRWLRSVHPPA